MKPLGSPSDPLEEVAEQFLQNVPSLDAGTVQYEPSIGSVASPVHRAVESRCFNVDAVSGQLFLKVRYPDMAPFFDEAAVHEGAKSASETGVGPRLIHADPKTGCYLFERLGEDWHWGKVDDFADRTVLEHTVAAKKTLHKCDPASSNRSVFDVIEDYAKIVDHEQISVPKTLPVVLQKVRRIAEAITAAGVSPVPCHADGVASNVMISTTGAVRLVDFDSYGNQDLFFDLGSVIVEIAQFPDLARAVLEIYDGECRQTEFNRCMLYGIADDLKWALWGFISFKRSQRSQVEFVKYAEWRLLRGLANADGPDFDRWLTKL